jgi:hypothetical protein
MATPTPERPASHPSVLAEPATDAVTQTLALLQPWIDYVPRQQRRLGLFIFLALLANVAFFFFIRIYTTRAALQHQVRPHVTVENPQTTSTEITSGDDFWDRLTDPRLFLLPLQPNAGPAGPEIDFTAVNPSTGPAELPAPAVPEDYRFAPTTVTPLPQQAEEAMRPPRQPFYYDETPPVLANVTTWKLDEALAARAPSHLPDLPSPISDTDLNPTELFVAVGPDGSVEHVLVEQSCGNMGASIAKGLDQQAVLAARKIRFKPVDQAGLVWGRLTVFWHYSAKPREEVVPTPPSGP